MSKLRNKVAIITGGAQGIGKTTVERFLEEGAKVAIWDIDAEKGKQVVSQLNGSAGKIIFQKVNTTQFEQCEQAAAEVVQQFGSIDILVNNAGITRDASFKKMSTEQWQQVIDVNLTGVFNCAKAVTPYMSEQGSGRVINAASVVAHYGNFGQTNYVASKAGVIGMTKVWAREFGRKGILVNAIAPGFIETEMILTVPEEVLDGLRAKSPLQRLGQPKEIADAYVFLAGPDSSYITGTVLNVDGGLTL